MKSIKHIVSAAVLALAVSSSTMAGDISGGFAIAAGGDISGGKAAVTVNGDISGGKAGDISGGKAGDISGGKAGDISGGLLQVALWMFSIIR